jgi:hypothetical protein
MTTAWALIAVGSVIMSSAAGCGSSGVVDVVRIVEDGGGTTEEAGGSPAPPCPSDWTCTDFSSLGATATDQDGKPVSSSCGQGKLMDCNDADPAATCASLPAPICAHVHVSGMDIVSCGQRCTP